MNSTNTSCLDYTSLKTDLDIDEFCRNIVTENGFFPNAALNLLKSIVKCCISSDIIDAHRIITIVNSDINLIVDLLSINKNPDFGFLLLQKKDCIAHNVLNVLRYYMNVNLSKII